MQKKDVPQIQEKLPLIREISDDAFWEANDILALENVRKELRDLIQFIVDGDVTIIKTNLTDPIISQEEGMPLDTAYDFEDYRAKVNRYIHENGNSLAIHKLTHNIPLTALDYSELERVLTEELGTREDYRGNLARRPSGFWCAALQSWIMGRPWMPFPPSSTTNP